MQFIHRKHFHFEKQYKGKKCDNAFNVHREINVISNKYWKNHNPRYKSEVDARNKVLYELQDKRKDYDLILAKYHHNEKE